ncbi:MAG: hypothetical protein KC609_12895, partial [Myxococcales bacterium]|nr:hypothetical protein [Myxococcales bacterium]
TKAVNFLFEGGGENPRFVGDYAPDSHVLLNENGDSLAKLGLRADWLDLVWRSRMRISVENPGAPLVEYPLAITIDAIEDDFWGHLTNLDPAQLRLTSADGKTEIPFYIEDFADGSDLLRSCPNLSGILTSSAPLAGPFDLDGKTLAYRSMRNAYSVVFVGNGLTIDQVVAQINAHSGPLRASVVKGRLRFELEKIGEYHYSMEVPASPGPNDAWPLLGIAPGVYTENFHADPVFDAPRIGVPGPCMNLWLQAPTLPTGTTHFYLYYDYVGSSVSSKSDEDAVFRYSTPQPTHVLLSDREIVGDLFVASFDDGNQIRLGDLSGPLLSLDALIGSIFAPTDLVQGARVLTRGNLALYSDADNTNALAPLAYRGLEFALPTIRGQNTFVVYAPAGDATVRFDDLLVGTGLTINSQNIDVPAGSFVAVDFDTEDRDPSDIGLPRNVVRIRSFCDSGPGCVPQPVVIVHRGRPNATIDADVDSLVLYPASTDLWGIVSAQAHLAAIDEETQLSVFTGGNLRFNVTLAQGQTYTTGSSNQGTGVSVHVMSRINAAPVGMIQTDDRDGNESTVFLPYVELARRYLIPRPAEYVAIATTWPNTTCRLRFGTCQSSFDCVAPSVCSDGRCQATKTSQLNDYPTPNKIYFGNALLVSNCAQDSHCSDGQRCVQLRPGVRKCRFPIDLDANNRFVATELICDERVWAIFEDAETNDEKNLFGAKSRRKVVESQWPTARVTIEREGYYFPTGYVDTPTFVAQYAAVRWLDVDALVQIPASTTLTYQLDIGGGWLYFDGQAWVTTQNSLSLANPLAVLKANIGSLPHDTGQLRFRVILRSNTLDTPTIDTLTLTADTLDSPPKVVLTAPTTPVFVGTPVTLVATFSSSDDQPLPGFPIVFSQVDGPASGSFSPTPARRTSDANGQGSVSFVAPAPGSYTLQASVVTPGGTVSDQQIIVVVALVGDPDDSDDGFDGDDGTLAQDADLADLEAPDLSSDLETADAPTDLDVPDDVSLGDLADDLADQADLQPEIDVEPDADSTLDAPGGDGSDLEGDLVSDIDGADDATSDAGVDTGGYQERLSGTTVFGCSVTRLGLSPTPLPVVLLALWLFATLLSGLRRRS